MARYAVLGVAALGVVGCTSAQGAAVDSAKADSIARTRQDSINRAQPGYVIDSVLPVEEELRRFREAIGGRAVSSLAHASSSRDALVRRVIDALSLGDTADLRAMTLTPREFADLVFPSSPFSRPPYRQPIGLVWQRIASGSETSRLTLVRRFGGLPLRYVDHECPSGPERQGSNTMWSGCVVRVARPTGDTLRLHLIGSIVERGGRYKVIAFQSGGTAR